jgi:hypothetical protein
VCQSLKFGRWLVRCNFVLCKFVSELFNPISVRGKLCFYAFAEVLSPQKRLGPQIANPQFATFVNSRQIYQIWYTFISLSICDLQNLYVSKFADQSARGFFTIVHRRFKSFISMYSTCILSIRILDLVKNLAVCDYGH